MFALRNGVSGARTFSTTLRTLQKSTPDIYAPQVPKEITSGAPPEVSQRMVRIYKEAKPAAQSSNNAGRFWKIDWDIPTGGHRWENDLIGYASTSDIMNATSLRFDTKEAAVRFAEGQGYDYYIYEPKEKKFRKKEYAANFFWSSKPLKHIRTK